MTRVTAALLLLLQFGAQVIVGGATTAWLIVRPGPRPAPALARMSVGPLSPTGAIVMAALVSLSPGTTTIDIDLDSRTLLLHLLDGTDPGASISRLRDTFERHLLALFPGPDA
jgi:multisubunit Na+/H+ antiporter MnhE subunit